jgi:hypothetical protein
MIHKIVFLFLLFFFLAVGSCKKKPICACETEHPEENLAWLKNSVDRLFCAEVYSLIFDGKEYIVISDCPGPDEMAVFFDCQGNKTCEYGGINAGGGSCFMPVGFTFEFYEAHKELIFKKNVKP